MSGCVHSVPTLKFISTCFSQKMLLQWAQHMAAPAEIVRIRDRARETLEAGVQRLIVRARSEKLPGTGDILPSVKGRSFDPKTQSVEPLDLRNIDGIVVISVVNACGTPVCDKQMIRMNEFADQNPDITVVSITKQPWNDELIATAKWLKGKHRLVSIDDEAAADLGVGLEPDEGADEEYRTMLLRKALVRNSMNFIVYDEVVWEQMDEPKYEPLFRAARDEYLQYMSPF